MENPLGNILSRGTADTGAEADWMRKKMKSSSAAGSGAQTGFDEMFLTMTCWEEKSFKCGRRKMSV